MMPCWSQDGDPCDEEWKFGVDPDDLPIFHSPDPDAWMEGVDPNDLSSEVHVEVDNLVRFPRHRWLEFHNPQCVSALPIASFRSFPAVRILPGSEELTFSRGKLAGALSACEWLPEDAIPLFEDPDDLLVFVGIPEEPMYASRAMFFAFVVPSREVGGVVPHQ